MSDRKGQVITWLLALATVVATLVAAYPSFLLLTRDRSRVYYQVTSLSVINPASPDRDSVAALLRMASIPTARTLLHVENKGTGPARDVRVRIRTEGAIRRTETVPKVSDRAPWLTFRTDSLVVSDSTTARLELADLAPYNILSAGVGYEARVDSEPHPLVEVYFDGRAAERVADLAAAEAVTVIGLLGTPLIVFAIGALATLAVAFASVLRSNEALARAFTDLLSQSVSSVLRVWFR